MKTPEKRTGSTLNHLHYHIMHYHTRVLTKDVKFN